MVGTVKSLILSLTIGFIAKETKNSMDHPVFSAKVLADDSEDYNNEFLGGGGVGG